MKKQKEDDILRDKLIDEVCKMLNIHLSHWDHCQYKDNPNLHDGTLLKVPTCATIYSEPYGSWQAMILQDMRIMRPYDDQMIDMTKMIAKIARMLVKGNHDKEENLKKLKEAESELRKKHRLNRKVKKFLIENDGVRLLASKFT